MNIARRLVLLCLLWLCAAGQAYAQANTTTLTAATGGGAISANTNSASGTGAWTTLTGPALAETKNKGIGLGTIILNAPSGFEFNTGNTVTASVSTAGGANELDLASSTATVTATTITITVTGQSAGTGGGVKSTITWSGIQVRPTGCTLASGAITKTGTSTYSIQSGGSYGTLTEVAGAAYKLAFVQQPTGTTPNTSISPAITVQVQDACSNNVSTTSSIAMALNQVSGSGTLTGTTPRTAVSGLATFNNLQVTAVGAYTLTASSSGLVSATSNSFNITSTQTISFPSLPTLAYNGTATASATATSGLTVTFTSLTPAVCTVSGTTVTAVGAVGSTCTIAANQAGNAFYSAATQVTNSINITKANQTISFPAQSPSAQAFSVGGTFSINPLATASSGLAVSYSSTTTGVCTVSGTTVTMVAPGTCTIAANQAGDTNWNAATQVTQSVSLTGKANQTITFGAQAAQTYSSGGTFAISPLATASSGLAVSYGSATTGVCTVSGTTVTIVTAGTCTITADQAGNASYNAAAQVTQNVTISKANQTITFGAQAAQTYSSGGTFAISPLATASSGLAITYTSTTTGVCTVSGTTVTIVTAGTCTLAANQAGDTNYNAATQVTQNVTINKASQTIGTVSFSPTTLAVGGTTTVSATATSGLAITFTSTTPSICTISGTTVTGVAAGTCTIAANQAGNTNYNAATQVTGNVTVSAASPANSTVVASPTTVTADGTSTTTITVTLKNGAGTALAGKTVTLAGTGSASITTVSGTTNASGVATFTATNTVAETVTFTATDVTDSIVVTQTAAVVFNLAAPIVTTTAATALSPPSSWANTLNGTVWSKGGGSVLVSFDYGLTTAYGYSITATGSPLADPNGTTTNVSAQLEGLTCETTYHYRTNATNNAGTTVGNDISFTTGACGPPFPLTACAATRYGSNLGCTANDVNLSSVVVAPGSPATCISGTPITLDLDLTVNFASPNRYDVGIFIANDAKSPSSLVASGGATSCTVGTLPLTSPFLDLDGAPAGNAADVCGDGNSSINGGTGSGVYRMTGVQLPCYSPGSDGKMFVPFLITWDNQASPVGGICQGSRYVYPNTTSKCNVPSGNVSIEVVVLPKIFKTHSGGTFSPGDPITYTVTVFNDSGGTLLPSVLTDKITDSSDSYVATSTKMTISNVTCSATNGATCPTSDLTTGLKGSGISISSANIPNNGSLVFTVTGTFASASPAPAPNASIGDTIRNTATITIGGQTKSANDDVALGAPSAQIAFSPSSIPENNTSTMTITFTNPLPTAVTSLAFSHTYPSGQVNATVPNATTTCGGTVTASAAGNTLDFSGGTIPANGTCTVTVTVTSASTNTYINTISFTASTAIASASASLSVTTPVYGGFNACNTATAPNSSCTSATTTINSRLGTKIAGKDFYVDIVALNTNGTRNTSYSSTVKVELFDASNNTGTADAYGCRSTWTLAATLSPNPAFVSGNSGLLTVGPFNITAAMKDVRVKITSVGGGSTRIGCSTDNFSIRPAGFVLASTAANADSTGASVSAPPKIAAGSGSFAMTATAVNEALGTVLGYNGTPLVDGARLVAHSGAVQAGSLSGSFGATSATTGVASGTFSYSEVGYFRLAANGIYESSFTTVDQGNSSKPDCVLDSGNPTADANFSNTANVSGVFGCGVGNTTATDYFGRFTPNRLLVTPGTPAAGCGSAFTYFGQDGFTTPFTLTAQGYNTSSSTYYTTANYSGSFARFGIATYANYSFTYAPTLAGATLSSSATAPSGSWANGVASISAKHKLSRPTALTAPTGITISATPTDSDAVAAATAAVSTTSTELRYGRLRLANAYGAENLPLLMTAQLEYCSTVSGSNCTLWVLNTDDGCSKFSTLSGPATGVAIVPSGTATGSTTPRCNVSGSTCTATTGGVPCNDDTTTVTGGKLGLCLSAPNASGHADITFSPPDYLQVNGVTSPKGRAGFGVYNAPGSARGIIYRREMR